jgi:hypothetical protein
MLALFVTFAMSFAGAFLRRSLFYHCLGSQFPDSRLLYLIASFVIVDEAKVYGD